MDHKAATAAAALAACLCAGQAPAAEPHARGRQTLSFQESDPLGDFATMKRRLESSFDDSDNAGKDKPYDVSSFTYEVVVPESYDKDKPAPLFVWISATDGGGMQRQLRDSLEKRGYIYAGANGTGNSVWPPIRFRAAIDAVFNLRKLYNIDPNHIFVAGNSGGGRCASMVAIGYPDVFTGGGFYVIGCNFWDNLPSGNGSYYPGFMKKRDGKLFALAKSHYYVFLTGTKDFNRDGTSKAFIGYRGAGFTHCFYNETPELGHSTPPAEDIEKAFAFLDESINSDALEACEKAEKLVAGRKYAQAAELLSGARGRLSRADALWAKLAAMADEETDKALAELAKNPSQAVSRLRRTAESFGPLGKRAADALETAKYMRGAPLNSVCGVKFGPADALDDSARIGTSSSYRFEPAKRFRRFSEYMFSVTPKSRQVYGVRLSAPALDDAGKAAADHAALLSQLQRQYMKEPRRTEGGWEFVFPGADGAVGRRLSLALFPDGRVVLTAVDLKLKALAEEERRGGAPQM